MSNDHLTFEGFLYRWIAAIALVLGTYNPSEFSYVSWIANAKAGDLPFIILVGAFLTIGYVVVMRTTFRSLGNVGVALLVTFFAATIWSLVSLGWIDLKQHSALLYLVLFSIATILAIGMSWSFIRKEISGQVDVNG